MSAATHPCPSTVPVSHVTGVGTVGHFTAATLTIPNYPDFLRLGQVGQVGHRIKLSHTFVPGSLPREAGRSTRRDTAFLPGELRARLVTLSLAVDVRCDPLHAALIVLARSIAKLRGSPEQIAVGCTDAEGWEDLREACSIASVTLAAALAAISSQPSDASRRDAA